MTDLTNLESVLAVKIAALTGTETNEDLLLLKKSCENTTVDTTVLDAAIQVFSDALTSSSTTEEVLISSKSLVDPLAPMILDKVQQIIDTPAASSGGKQLIMPHILISSYNTYIKERTSEIYNSTEDGFYSRLSDSNLTEQEEVAVLTTVPGPTYWRTIASTASGTQGVITCIMSPGSTSSSNVYVRVTLDGVEHLFTSYCGSSTRLIVGHTLSTGPNDPDDDLSCSVGAGTCIDEGFYDKNVTIVRPFQAILDANIGMAFTDSMKVEIMSDLGWSTITNVKKSLVLWVNYIPKGVSV